LYTIDPISDLTSSRYSINLGLGLGCNLASY